MASTTFYPGFRGPEGAGVHGGTALGAHPQGAGHRVGNVLRAVRVYLGAAVEVVILGNDGKQYVIDEPLSRWRTPT